MNDTLGGVFFNNKYQKQISFDIYKNATFLNYII